MENVPRQPSISILGVIAIALLGVVMISQLLLATGVLPVTMAWGGRQTELTPNLRLSSLIAFLILGGFAYIIARRAGIMGKSVPSLMIKILAWMITAYLVFNTVMNFLSPSLLERWIFGPVTLVLVWVCLAINIMKYPHG